MATIACHLSLEKLFQANLATDVKVCLHRLNTDLKKLFAIHATKPVTLQKLAIAGGRCRIHQHHGSKTVVNLNQPTKLGWKMVQYSRILLMVLMNYLTYKELIAKPLTITMQVNQTDLH